MTGSKLSICSYPGKIVTEVIYIKPHFIFLLVIEAVTAIFAFV